MVCGLMSAMLESTDNVPAVPEVPELRLSHELVASLSTWAETPMSAEVNRKSQAGKRVRGRGVADIDGLLRAAAHRDGDGTGKRIASVVDRSQGAVARPRRSNREGCRRRARY